MSSRHVRVLEQGKDREGHPYVLVADDGRNGGALKAELREVGAGRDRTVLDTVCLNRDNGVITFVSYDELVAVVNALRPFAHKRLVHIIRYEDVEKENGNDC